ncbi:MAG: hypothetical protein K0S34_2444 [Bacillales bacterium]|jgi:uncharacterized protein (DUF2225 family)|nr:hypothetical protein [Bacillales bacterium]
MTTNIDPLYDKRIKCIYCSHDFTSKKVRSRASKSISVDEDYCTYFQDEENSPYLYYVSVCPKCGFAFSEQFAPYFRDDIRVLIHSKIMSKWQGLDFSGKRSLSQAVSTYKLGIYSATLKQEKHIILAGLYIRLCWLYRKEHNKDQEERFMRLALSEYEQSYMNGDYESTEMTEIRIGYIIGELHRRLKNYKESIQYFNRVVTQQNKSIEPGTVKIAREQWYKVREEAKEYAKQQLEAPPEDI